MVDVYLHQPAQNPKIPDQTKYFNKFRVRTLAGVSALADFGGFVAPEDFFEICL